MTDRLAELQATEQAAYLRDLRVRFAIAALPGVMDLCRNDSIVRIRSEEAPSYFAAKAFEIADAMVAEADKEPS